MHGNKAIVHAHFSYVMTPAEGFNFVIETKHGSLWFSVYDSHELKKL